MKLLFYSPRFYPLLGGLERVVEAWAMELTKRGVSVCVVTSTPTEIRDEFIFPVYRQLSFFKLVKLMRSVDAVVQFNVALKGLPSWWLSRKPLVITHHTFLVEPGKQAPWQQKLKLLVSNSLAVKNICCSQYIARQFREAVVIYSPYHARLFANKKCGRQPGSLVFAGRLVTDKGVDLLLKALSLVDPALYTHLVIAGDGPEKEGLVQLTGDFHLGEKVVFRGKLTAAEMVDLLNNSVLMIVPSVVEPFGITVLEGLACGCRMVVSDTGGLPEAAGGFAELFESRNVESLASAIKKAVANPIPVDEMAVSEHLKKMTVEHTAMQFYEVIANNIDKFVNRKSQITNHKS